MAPYTLRRSDEPYLFDAMCALFEAKGISDGRYGVVTIRGVAYDFFFKTPTHVLVIIRNTGTYTELEDAALDMFNAKDLPLPVTGESSFWERPQWCIL